MDDVNSIYRSELGETLATARGNNIDDMRQWLDLSTTTPPWSWAVTHVPELVWRNAPDIAKLEQQALEFYGATASQVVATQGAQQAIEHIPQLVDPLKVAMPRLGYEEHAFHWQQAGHTLVYYRSFKELVSLVADGDVEAAVVINPNNPTGVNIPKNHLQSLQQAPGLKLLLVDEVLAELAPENSIAESANAENTIVLRSLSKFYGLSGMRLGFAIGGHPLLNLLRKAIGIWPVSNVAAHVAPQLFADKDFYDRQKARIDGACRQLVSQLSQPFEEAKILKGGLFVTVVGKREKLEAFYESALDEAVLLKLGHYDETTAWLRVGIAKHYLQFRDVCEKFAAL